MATVFAASSPPHAPPDPHRSELTDEALLLWYRNAGDEDAFRELIARHENELFHYLCRYLHDASLAEEVLEATLVRLYEHRRDFQPGHRVRPWLFTIATHLAIDTLRRAGRHHAASLDAEHGDEANLADLLTGHADEPSARIEADERGTRLHNAVDALAPRLREAINLVYFRGLKYGDAAKRLNVPMGTLKSRLHEALVKLKTVLNPLKGEPK
jgi:RNA polymerase sigma-70 factor (ECF subfamily)